MRKRSLNHQKSKSDTGTRDQRKNHSMKDTELEDCKRRLILRTEQHFLPCTPVPKDASKFSRHLNETKNTKLTNKIQEENFENENNFAFILQTG